MHVVLLRVLNTLSGKEVEDMVDKRGVPVRNENGERMIGFCVERERCWVEKLCSRRIFTSSYI